ncbi:hypothetical protein HAX54_035869 [Datura stramonium]|uniref:Uncharacterized protein n=1 Tax=Datura stramonium TaxID=4076 RepID=A0ABS8SFQ2_DATST|nr:hypothetical protein [Datura stramonium]
MRRGQGAMGKNLVFTAGQKFSEVVEAIVELVIDDLVFSMSLWVETSPCVEETDGNRVEARQNKEPHWIGVLERVVVEEKNEDADVLGTLPESLWCHLAYAVTPRMLGLSHFGTVGETSGNRRLPSTVRSMTVNSFTCRTLGP